MGCPATALSSVPNSILPGVAQAIGRGVGDGKTTGVGGILSIVGVAGGVVGVEILAATGEGSLVGSALAARVGEATADGGTAAVAAGVGRPISAAQPVTKKLTRTKRKRSRRMASPRMSLTRDG
jgi:hypothetical protein